METLRRLLDLLGDELELSAEPIDYGHDRAMLQANLARTPSERVDRGVALADFVRRNRGVARDGAVRAAGSRSVVERDLASFSRRQTPG